MIKKGIFAIACLIILFITSFHIVLSKSFDNTIVGFSLIVAIISVLYWIAVQQKSKFKGLWAKPSNLFFLSNFIVSFQWIADVYFGYNPSKFFLYITEQSYNKGAILGVIAIFSFILGYCIKYNKGKEDVSYKKYRVFINKKSPSILIFFEWLFFCLFIVNINISDFITGESYSSNNEVSLFGYFENLFLCSIIAVVVQILINIRSSENKSLSFFKSFPILSLIPIILYIILRGLSGDRGPIIYTILLFFYSYIYITHKKIKFIKLFIAVFICGVIISIAGIARLKYDMSISDKFSTAISEYSKGGRFGGQSVFAPTQELSISYICTHEAINQIEYKNYNLNWGGYQLVHLINIIPYAPSFLREKLNIPNERLSSTILITNSVLGKNSSWSLGSSMIADFFLDFRAIGVAIGFLIVGMIFYWVDNIIYFNSNNVSPVLLSICLFTASRSLYFPRAAFLGVYKFLIITFILLFITQIIQNKFNVKICQKSHL